MSDHDVKLENHEQQIRSLKHRMDNQEEQTKVMQELIVSVKLLAVNMENMLESQKSQGLRLEKLESEPGENWKNIKRILVTAIISAVVGGIISGYFL